MLRIHSWGCVFSCLGGARHAEKIWRPWSGQEEGGIENKNKMIELQRKVVSIRSTISKMKKKCSPKKLGVQLLKSLCRWNKKKGNRRSHLYVATPSSNTFNVSIAIIPKLSESIRYEYEQKNVNFWYLLNCFEKWTYWWCTMTLRIILNPSIPVEMTQSIRWHMQQSGELSSINKSVACMCILYNGMSWW